MPALEAMASGLAVVTTSCLGVGSFARPGSNCLMAAPQVCGWGVGVGGWGFRASGLALVATSCLGLRSFARPGANYLVAAPQVGCSGVG